MFRTLKSWLDQNAWIKISCFRFKNLAPLFLDCLSKQIPNDLPIFFNIAFPYKLVFLPFSLPPPKRNKINLHSELKCERFESWEWSIFKRLLSLSIFQIHLVFHSKIYGLHIFGSEITLAPGKCLLKLTGYLVRYLKGRKSPV